MTAGGSVTNTIFAYQGGIIVGETVNGTPSRTYIYAGGSMAEVTIPSGSGAGTYVVTWNGHGDATSLNIVNADGSVTPVNSYAYSTWGAPTTSVASGAADLGSRFLYVGSGDVQWDSDFGLGQEYMHARNYSTGLARFLQRDPSGVDAGFAYASDSPVSRADPSGLFQTVLYSDPHKITKGFNGAAAAAVMGTGCAVMVLGGITEPIAAACGIISLWVGIQTQTYVTFVLSGVETGGSLVLLGMECMADGWGDKVCQLSSYVVWAKKGSSWAGLDRRIMYALRQSWVSVWRFPGTSWIDLPGARFVGSGSDGPATHWVCHAVTTGLCS